MHRCTKATPAHPLLCMRRLYVTAQRRRQPRERPSSARPSPDRQPFKSASEITVTPHSLLIKELDWGALQTMWVDGGTSPDRICDCLHNAQQVRYRAEVWRHKYCMRLLRLGWLLRDGAGDQRSARREEERSGGNECRWKLRKQSDWSWELGGCILSGRSCCFLLLPFVHRGASLSLRVSSWRQCFVIHVLYFRAKAALWLRLWLPHSPCVRAVLDLSFAEEERFTQKKGEKNNA